ncbi:MAG: tetratricopeptide repeat protein [Magnetococcales bacterium]|nr:tetratricopeptide repeat protein [Magnetococcales bacterium]
MTNRPPGARTPEEVFAAAVDLQQRGELAGAARLLERLLELFPDNQAVLRNLALIREQTRNPEAALALLERAARAQPEDTGLEVQIGNILMTLDRPREAASRFRQVLAREPGHGQAANNLGLALQGLADWDGAVAAYRQALAQGVGGRHLVHNNLGVALRALARREEALEQYLAALEIQPDYPEALNNLGILYKDLGRWEESEAVFRKALRLRPQFHKARNNLGTLLRARDRFLEAAVQYRQILREDRELFEVWNNLANVLGDLAEVEQAVGAYEAALELNPGAVHVHSNLIMNLHYLPQWSAPALLERCRAFDARHTAPLTPAAPAHANRPDPERPLRVGYVSPDFRQHPVGFFWQPVMANHDARQWEIFCYAGHANPDWVTKRIQGWAPHWREVRSLPDAELAELIRHDGIDILVDLSGHTDGHRLMTFARRPAPVQLTAGGHFNTTGVGAIDYLLCDRFHVPPGAEAYISEQPLRLPDGYVCYAPPAYAPPVGPLPASEQGQVTFGCCNNLMKVTPEVIRLWATILQDLPGSRIRLTTRALGEPVVRRKIQDLFAAGGIAADRVLLAGGCSHGELLATYGAIDIALDPFPYSGGLTTLEALWMGVPVVTLSGTHFCTRHSTSHLSNAGLDELVTTSPDQYRATALGLAADLSALARLRAGLRSRVARSSLCDGGRYTRTLETAFRDIWRRWCQSR